MLLFDLMDVSWEWCVSHQPKIAVLVIFSVALIFITVKILKLLSKLSDVETVGNSNKNSIEDEVKPKLLSIDRKLGILIAHICATDQNLNPNVFVSHSPIQLTPIGDEILENMRGKKYLDANLGSLIFELEQLKPKTALDVQSNCETILFSLSTEDGFTEIKKFIYTNPIYIKKREGYEAIQIPLDLKVAINIMAIYLRNKYLDKYPELDIEE